MFINNGFKFINDFGHYTDINPYNNEKDGYIYKDSDLGGIDIYTQEKASETTALLEFASLDPNNSTDIVNFTNKYGFLHTDDTKENSNHNSILKYSQHAVYECIPLDDYKYWIYRFEKILLLQRYIEKKDMAKMLDICFYFLFIQKPCSTFSCDDIDDWTSSTETEYFEECLLNFIDYEEIENLPKLEQIRCFIDDIRQEWNNCKENPSQYLLQKYPTFQSNLWESVVILFEYLDSKHKIIMINESGITFDDSSNVVDTLPKNIKLLITTLSKNIILDLVNTGLENIQPVIKIENNSFVGDWEINSLLDVLHFELFLLLSQDSITKRCPCCGNFFEVAKTNSRKIYCSKLCSQRIAKRRERERKKKLSEK